MAKLKVQNINFGIGNTKILKEVSFEVEKNSFVGIIGPNGSGKSTTLKCIYGVNKPKGGEILFEGEKLLSMPSKERAKKIAVLAQESGGQFDFTVGQVVEMGRYPHKKTLENYSKEDEEIIENVLEKMKLQDYKERSFNTLSGGEKQRVLIARLLIQQSDFIILDEPTNHLDIGHQIDIMNTIKGMGVTVLAAIHDMNMAALYCDKVILMKKGEVLKQGSVEEVLTPDMLKTLFNVNAEIHDFNGRKQIIYNP
ncbi:MAG: ABC transporter ATP-binding protein [Flavobacteriaceae bacterium]|nr:ABC transporter ATP-binding protein [Flavobacteriaceae bacterium]